MKSLVAAAAALSLLVTCAAIAQTNPPAVSAPPASAASPPPTTAAAPASSAAAGERGARMIERMCGAPVRGKAGGRYAERLAARLSLNDQQKALLKDWQDARLKAREDARTALCAPKPDLSTFEGRLDYRQKRLETQFATFKATRPPLEAFYKSLSDQQKASWDEARTKTQERRSRRRRN